MIKLDEPTDDLLDDLFHAIDRPGATDLSDALFQRSADEITRLLSFVRDRVHSEKVRKHGGYHGRRLYLEAEKILNG